jgi:hypothetical protein
MNAVGALPGTRIKHSVVKAGVIRKSGYRRHAHTPRPAPPRGHPAAATRPVGPGDGVCCTAIVTGMYKRELVSDSASIAPR